jgi:hypothetical protein
VKAADGTIYKVEWFAGDSTWSQGDNVILNNDDGRGQMVSPDDGDKLTDVWVEEVDD